MHKVEALLRLFLMIIRIYFYLTNNTLYKLNENAISTIHFHSQESNTYEDIRLTYHNSQVKTYMKFTTQCRVPTRFQLTVSAS